MEVSGHTDNVGNATANLSLSKNRANSVKEYLISGGIEASRLNSKGYGANKPISDNSTVEGRAKNRRTEFQIIAL
ncbi:MAG: OmpA family protein [Flavobacteriales bacterium]|nr:OmpA family protein [Flavobacteriales bacterium]